MRQTLGWAGRLGSAAWAHDHEHRPRRELPAGMREQLDLPHAGMVSFGQRPFLTERRAARRVAARRGDRRRPVRRVDDEPPRRPLRPAGDPGDGATSRARTTWTSAWRSSTGWRSSTSATPTARTARPSARHANIRERVHAGRLARHRAVVLGGDHSITWPAATAVADVHGYGNVGIVHFDAHADTADIIEGNLASHGTPMRRLIESGAVPGTHFVQVGLRGYWPPQDTFEWMLEQGMTWHTMQEIWERGFKDVMADAVGEALAKADKLYISVDIDVLDPAFAPGTGTPEPGGIPSSDLLRMVRQLCHEHDVVGVDVVEVAPAYDVSDLTVNAAHRVVFEALAGMAARRRDAAGAAPGPPAR